MRKILSAGFFVVVLCGAVWLYASLRPAAASGEPRDFEIAAGAGFMEITNSLAGDGLIRSKSAFEIYVVLSGRARSLQPGRYKISPAYSGARISAVLASGPELETTVTIPEGTTSFDMDRILSAAKVTDPGEFLAYLMLQSRFIEGYLFPDTYRFYFDSSPKVVLEKMLDNFKKRAEPILADSTDPKLAIILASILEKEVKSQEDREIVAGLLIKRVKAGMPLQVDASLCYAKEMLDPEAPCEPLTKLDKKIDSPYNTYLHSGWPPGAIANPGVLAIQAALHPKDSPYWYYLSDPKSGKTIFAKTIEEQVMNQLKYLNND